MLEGTAKIGAQTVKLPDTRIVADQISFAVFAKAGDASSRHEFRGTIKGAVIEGTVSVGTGNTQKQMPWKAALTTPAGGAK
jgi:hypothetical protein